MSSFFDKVVERIFYERLELLNRLSEKEIIVPTVEQIILINERIMEFYGGIHSIRDRNLLDSAIGAVYNHINYSGEKNVIFLSLLLAQKIIQSHPFIDGNKRTAVLTCDLMLEMNNVFEKFSNDFLYKFSYNVAKGKIKTPEDLKELLFTKFSHKCRRKGSFRP